MGRRRTEVLENRSRGPADDVRRRRKRAIVGDVSRARHERESKRSAIMSSSSYSFGLSAATALASHPNLRRLL